MAPRPPAQIHLCRQTLQERVGRWKSGPFASAGPRPFHNQYGAGLPLRILKGAQGQDASQNALPDGRKRPSLIAAPFDNSKYIERK